MNLEVIAASLVFTVIGMGIFAFGFWSFDRITPYHLWKEIIDKQNVALAIVVGAVTLGLSLIISAAIHS